MKERRLLLRGRGSVPFSAFAFSLFSIICENKEKLSLFFEKVLDTFVLTN
jgi:hypothetical protein